MIKTIKSNKPIFLASVISNLTSPVVVAFFFLMIEINRKLVFTIEFLLFTIILLSLFIPVYISYLIKDPTNLLKRNKINRKDREWMYLSLTVGSLINVLLFAQDFSLRYFISLGMIMTIFWGLMYIINKIIDKLSLHSSMLTFAIIAITDINPLFLTLLLMLPAVCWSRITLHKHTWFQLILGIIVGAVCGVLFWSL